ncbi:hypothetical protein FACS189496_4030 [Bacilli bacterium]|nr:hypothetical protein FACS189496_4030 [Bacilli bacterium]
MIDKPAKFIRSDSAKIPRIELMCHSKMSAFDGICAVGDVCNLVEKFNMPAVGFCDRCNTQSFPDMMKSKTKIIYGYEADAQPEIIKCVINQDDQKLSDATYVIFDIETTGFYSEFEDIIEFGAIKVKNDKIISKLDFFIKPNKPIPAKITELTHITQQMVDEEGIDIKDALIKIQHYCKGSVLIAHNGINFDIRFINKKLEKYGMELLTNPLIDTLQISRAINNDYSHHSLGVICRHCKIVYEEDVAHRADFDAEVLYYV